MIPGITGTAAFNLEPQGTIHCMKIFANKEFYPCFPSLPSLHPPQSLWGWFCLCRSPKIVTIIAKKYVGLQWLSAVIVYFLSSLKNFLWQYTDIRLGALLNCMPSFSDESKSLWTKSHISFWCLFSASFIKKLWAISSELVCGGKNPNKINKPCRNQGCKPNVIEVNHTSQTVYNVTSIYAWFSPPTHKTEINYFFLFYNMFLFNVIFIEISWVSWNSQVI